MVRIALHAADFLVRRGDFKLQTRLRTGVAAQLLQILQQPGDQQPPDRRRARQALDRVMHFEQHDVGQLPDIVKAPLGTGPFTVRNLRLSRRRHRPDDHGQTDSRRRGDAEAMAADVLAGHGTRGHRAPLEPVARRDTAADRRRALWRSHTGARAPYAGP